jgi:nucleoside phosphorylase
MPPTKRVYDENPSSTQSKRQKLEHNNDYTNSLSIADSTKSSRDGYTVGLICALPLELAAAQITLDEVHPNLPQHPNDYNTYTLGKIGDHNVVVACLPSGEYGTTSTARVSEQMLLSFSSIRFGLLLGIAGGAPSKKNDIRLGDVVISIPTSSFGGVVPYDWGKTIQKGRFIRTGTRNKPPQILLTAVSKLRAEHLSHPSRIPEILSELTRQSPFMREFAYPSAHHDELFEAQYEHMDANDTCDNCDRSRLVARPPRDGSDHMLHYGLIASGNQVMKHGHTREILSRELGILCFEMEAAGLMDNFPCLVIRGICDYADSHKNKEWQKYAAATAAAFAKELLCYVAVAESEQQIPIERQITSKLPASILRFT